MGAQTRLYPSWTAVATSEQAPENVCTSSAAILLAVSLISNDQQQTKPMCKIAYWKYHWQRGAHSGCATTAGVDMQGWYGLAELECSQWTPVQSGLHHCSSSHTEIAIYWQR